MTWVIADYSATPGTSELSVSKGQQVEVLDAINCAGAPEYCLVRLSGTPATSSSSAMHSDASDMHEGLVPVAVLKPIPTSKRGKGHAEEKDSDGQGIVFCCVICDCCDLTFDIKTMPFVFDSPTQWLLLYLDDDKKTFSFDENNSPVYRSNNTSRRYIGVFQRHNNIRLCCDR